LLRNVELEQGSEANAFRAGGETLRGYLGQKQVPFPNAKGLFPLVSASLTIRNALRGSSPAAKPYRGRISVIRLDDAVMERKKQLLYHYRSQIPALFGEAPDELLGSRHDAFSTEVTIEISRR